MSRWRKNYLYSGDDKRLQSRTGPELYPEETVPGPMLFREDDDATPRQESYFVLSIGLETPLYRRIRAEIPRLEIIVVDVRRFIGAPPRHRRARGARYPDRSVIVEVEGNAHFEQAVNECTNLLQRYRIVMVGCKSGVHRAPTVSARVGRLSSNAFTVHCSLNNMRFDDVMWTIRSCMDTSLITPQLHKTYSSILPSLRLCMGWAWTGTQSQHEDPIAQFEEVEFVRHHPTIKDCFIVTRLESAEGHRTVLSTWLLPRNTILFASWDRV